jgi:hypothetical protein
MIAAGTLCYPVFASTPGDAKYDFCSPSEASSFHFDLEFGNEQEREFYGDLFSQPVKFEVKADRKCFLTGNIAVEYKKKDFGGQTHLSGLSITDAQFYVFVLGSSIRLVVPTEALKHLARRAICEGRSRWIGDGGRFRNALIPLEWFATGWGAE